MVEWDTAGLPPVAAARLARAARSELSTSLLSVPSAYGIEAVGLEPVGEVMGCIVQHIGWRGWAGCGVYGFGGGYGIARSVPLGTYSPYVDTVRHGFDTALGRLRMEAGLLGADGVVDVKLSDTHLGEENHEFVAVGTAVRFRTGDRAQGTDNIRATSGKARRIFVSDLPGTDIAKLLLSGWLPTDIFYAISLVVRHDDWVTIGQQYRSAGNTEVTGYTQLVTHVKDDARRIITAAGKAAGADGVLVTDIRMRIWEQEPSEGHRDHLAEVRMFGTGVLKLAARIPKAPTTLTFLPLRP